jgi:tRNA modification GTPase
MVPAIASGVLGELPRPRAATMSAFRAADGNAIDQGLALYFPAPHSYTGEHVLELQGHGGPVLVQALIARALELGARRARPGEFTQRAYLNGKLDLAQAEAVADLIDAASDAAARAALRSLEGEFSSRVTALSEALGELRAYVEAAIDFADQPIEFLSAEALGSRLEALIMELHELQAAGRQGRLLTEGMTVVIAGRPNCGKSTLLNRLAGHEAAIVTDLPGTTRDVLRERILLDGMPLHLLDTAGLRAASDAIEAEGVRRAEAAMTRADRVLFLIDAVADPQGRSFIEERARLPERVPVTLVFNKVDLAPMDEDSVPAELLEQLPLHGSPPILTLSALTGFGIEALERHLRHSVGYASADGDALGARARHLEALARVDAHLAQSASLLARNAGAELVAEELKGAQSALGEIIGLESSDELLGRIFASFCIGK